MNKHLNIRRAGPSDVPLLLDLGRKTFFEAFAGDNTPENMALFLEAQFQVAVLEEEMQEEGAVFYLVYSGDIPAGYTKLRTGHEPPELWNNEPAKGRALEIERIYLLPAFQDQKIGSAVMEHNLAYARASGFNAIWLGVWEKNVHAIRFYERWDFQLFGSHIFMLGNDPQRDVLMRKQI